MGHGGGMGRRRGGIDMHRTTTTRVIAVLAIAAVGLSACGDDDDSSAGEANAEYAEFCTAELAVEAAVATQDPEAIEAAFTTLIDATPESSLEIVQTTVDEARAFMEAGGDTTPEFDAAYAEMIGVVKDNCGFAEWDVTTKDYEFVTDSAPTAAGGVVITLTNEGNEFHEVSIFRKNEGVTDSAKDLLALGEDESAAMVTQIGGAFAPPGKQGFTTADLAAGDYFIACFLPVGATQEAFDEMMATGVEPDGEPHFTLGMIKEFEVK
jgi:hypothetical protein